MTIFTPLEESTINAMSSFLCAVVPKNQAISEEHPLKQSQIILFSNTITLANILKIQMQLNIIFQQK